LEVISWGLYFSITILSLIFFIRGIISKNNSINNNRDKLYIWILPQILSDYIRTHFNFILGGLTVGILDVRGVILSATIFMTVSLVFMIMTYAKLHKHFNSEDKSINFGDETVKKETVKSVLIASTILTWLMYLIYVGHEIIVYILAKFFYFTQIPRLSVRSGAWLVNLLYIVIGCSMTILSIYSVYLAYNIGKNTGSVK
jgi:hypothetical protein